MTSSRLHAFVRTWPRWQAHAFAKYLRASGFAGGQVRTSRNGKWSDPFWWLLPQWLFDSYKSSKRKNGLSTSLLDDLKWGQYCIFLFLRIQDDVCDGKVDDRSLIYVGNEFLLEAEREFAKYFNTSSPFWKFYRRSLQDTIRSLVRIEILEQNWRTNPPDLIDVYAKVGHAFAIAPYALCTLLGQANSTNRALRFIEEMTVAGQIMDDLDDIHEDLKRDRYNYCTLVLLRGEKQRTVRGAKTYQMIYRSLLHSGRLNEILDQVRLHLSHARRSIAPLRLSAAEELVRDYRTGLDILSDTIHRRRVDILLGRFRH